MFTMAKTFVFSVMFVCLLSDLLPAQPLTMHIKMKNGTVHSFELKEIRKMTFQVNPHTDIAAGTGNLLQTFALYQNYPNPFNPSTSIRFDIPKDGLVKLVLYDVLGKEVATIVNGEKTAGSYIIDFNAGNLTSGIYFYKLTASDFSDIKKMVLLK